jgi:hypothetical protein
MTAMPEYQAQLERYSQHHQIAQRCMAVIQDRDSTLLNMITDIEQTLATGYDGDGQPLKLPGMVDQILDSLGGDDMNMKLRLALVLVGTQV